MAPYRVILRYYRCDTPYRAILLREVSTPPKCCDTLPWYLILHRHTRAIPHFATYRAITVRYPITTSTKKFCDTIATSIARYEKYRCWASKLLQIEIYFDKARRCNPCELKTKFTSSIHAMRSKHSHMHQWIVVVVVFSGLQVVEDHRTVANLWKFLCYGPSRPKESQSLLPLLDSFCHFLVPWLG